MDVLDTFTDKQRIIYEITKKYLQKYPHFSIEGLYGFCKRNCKLTDDEIIQIIQSFLRKKVFIPGTRLTKENILRNEKRSEILEFISANPGMKFTQIIKYHRIGPHAGRWHIEVLKKFGFITERKFTIFKVYFQINFPNDKEPIVSILRNPNTLKIYSILKEYSFNPNDLSKILDLHHSTIQYHLDRMLDCQIVRVDESNYYTTNPNFHEFLERYYDLAIPLELQDKISEIF